MTSRGVSPGWSNQIKFNLRTIHHFSPPPPFLAVGRLWGGCTNEASMPGNGVTIDVIGPITITTWPRWDPVGQFLLRGWQWQALRCTLTAPASIDFIFTHFSSLQDMCKHFLFVCFNFFCLYSFSFPMHRSILQYKVELFSLLSVSSQSSSLPS
jgi:hypothetical protein